MHKTCNRCKVEKTADQFFRCKSNKSGLRSYCKACDMEWKRNDRMRIHAAATEYRKSNAPKVRAKEAVQYALRMGTLRKQPCEICGDPKAYAHHDDYEKQLEVRWLCPSHHNQWHAENGEGKNGRTGECGIPHRPKTRLTDEIVIQIRSEYEPGSRTNGSTALAHKYGISASHVLGIVKEKTWKGSAMTNEIKSTEAAHCINCGMAVDPKCACSRGRQAASSEAAAGEFVPNTCGGFRGGFIALNKRAPTDQEIWNAGVKSAIQRYARPAASGQKLTDEHIRKIFLDNRNSGGTDITGFARAILRASEGKA